MAVTTDTYWDVDGVPLQTLAYNIKTWGGDLQAPPPLRGQDITIPYKPGTVWQPRVPDGRSISFDMWVNGADTDGKVPTSASMRAEFEKNLKTLRALFWKPGKQISITKRWKDYGSSTVKTATAKGVFAGGFVPSMEGALRASFSVDIYLSDPFFYGAETTVNFAATAVSNQTITVPGDYETTAITIEFDAPRNTMRLTNTSEGAYIDVNHDLIGGAEILVDVDKWTALKNPTGTPVNVVKDIGSFGHTYWFVLRPGSQTLSLTSSTGTGGATLKYRPRFI